MFEVIDLTGQTFFGLGTQFDPLLNCLSYTTKAFRGQLCYPSRIVTWLLPEWS